MRIATGQETLWVHPKSFGMTDEHREGIAGRRAQVESDAGKALEGRNPRSGSGVKHSRRVSKDKTLEGLRKAKEGRCSGGTEQEPICWLATVEGEQNLKGEALCSIDFGRTSERAAPAGVSEEAPKPWMYDPLSLESGNRREPENLEDGRKVTSRRDRGTE